MGQTWLQTWGNMAVNQERQAPCPHGGLYSSGQSQTIHQSANQQVTPVGDTSGKELKGLEGATCRFWMMREGVSEEGH